MACITPMGTFCGLHAGCQATELTVFSISCVATFFHGGSASLAVNLLKKICALAPNRKLCLFAQYCVLLTLIFFTGAQIMSYDTTVRDAIDPPQPRLSENPTRRNAAQRIWRSVLSIWRPLAATGVTICTLFLVTWVVATLTLSNWDDHPESARDTGDLQQEHLLHEPGN